MIVYAKSLTRLVLERPNAYNNEKAFIEGRLR